ncbi:MAG TPA: HAMP domain-containing sensor histidine kinase [Segetibacter sp.]|jgi:signal transduction histidine kinase
MSILKPKKLKVIIIVYWFLLVYIVAALVFWFITLNLQNQQMTEHRLQEVSLEDPAYDKKTQTILHDEKRKTTQYVAEGITFLAVILVGAVFVYRATRRQFRLSQQQQNFMMAITHELKTPIAITQLNLETLQKRKLEESQQQKLISNTLQEANRLNTLCNNILLASQLDAGAYKIVFSKIDFSAEVNSSVADFRSRFPERNIEANVKDEIYVNGEQLLLRMMVNNLIENALKYTPKDKKVTITLRNGGNATYLQVADEGFGIAQGEKRKIFEKFYRIGNEGTRASKGTGLGLFLCKRIVEDHNAEISVKDNQPDGSIFTVTFKNL